MFIKLLMLVIFFGIMIGVGFYSRRHATDVHGFDMLFPKREVSRQAVAKFIRQVAHALEVYAPARD